VDAYSENPKGVFSFYAESERALVREADMVLTTSPQLLEQHRPANPHTYYVPPGVDYEKFADDTLAEPVALKRIASPRLLFFGGIDERVDLDLLTRLAQTHPTRQFVFLGVVRTDVRALQRLPNAHFLGHISHEALPAYVQHANVLLLPYVRTVFSQFIQPAKLFECLATGKPIAALGLPVFQEYRDVMYVASDAADYGECVQRALDEKQDAAKIAARRERAQANTWDARFQALNEMMARRLQEKGQ
jgi:glycosyltransferase involved in cell wall biosynthesis